jgi:hypothetical protein
MNPPEQEQYLRTLAQSWRDTLRRQYRLPDPLNDAERDRILRDIAYNPDRWRPILSALLLPIITEIAAALAREIYHGRAA